MGRNLEKIKENKFWQSLIDEKEQEFIYFMFTSKKEGQLLTLNAFQEMINFDEELWKKRELYEGRNYTFVERCLKYSKDKVSKINL